MKLTLNDHSKDVIMPNTKCIVAAILIMMLSAACANTPAVQQMSFDLTKKPDHDGRTDNPLIEQLLSSQTFVTPAYPKDIKWTDQDIETIYNLGKYILVVFNREDFGLSNFIVSKQSKKILRTATLDIKPVIMGNGEYADKILIINDAQRLSTIVDISENASDIFYTDGIRAPYRGHIAFEREGAIVVLTDNGPVYVSDSVPYAKYDPFDYLPPVGMSRATIRPHISRPQSVTLIGDHLRVEGEGTVVCYALAEASVLPNACP